MNPINHLARRWARPAICLLLTHLSACVVDASTLSGLSPDDECVEVTSCDAGEECAPTVVCNGAEGTGPRYHTPPCTEGATRTCTIFLAENNGVTDCMPGVFVCSGGVWGEECLTLEQAAESRANEAGSAR